jgi:SpoVK/Ycf46/Vps4 family AAA+-type ATPase
MPEETIREKLSVLIRARYPLIGIQTEEEKPTLEMIKEIATRQKKKLYTWSITSGFSEYRKNDTSLECDPLEVLTHIETLKDAHNEGEKAIIALLDYHVNFDNPIIRRKIKEAYFSLEKTYRTIILIGSNIEIPAELQKYIHSISTPYPGIEKISEIWKDAYSSVHGSALRSIVGNPEEKIPVYSRACTGLTGDQISGIIRQGIARNSLNLNAIIEEKKQIIQKSGVLTYYDTSDISINDIGGLDILKMRIARLPARFSEKAEKFGLEKPKGFICIGPPGTGKSLSAKVTAAEMNVPLIVLSMSQIASKWYGESTSNMRNALDLISALSPCVVLIDEIEKVLSSGGSGETHEETSRMLGEFLTFIEENKAPILFIGTCNDRTGLKPELVQRFENMFFVDLPNQREREEIFKIHLQKTGRNPEKFNIPVLADRSAGYVGREIKVIIKEALSNAFFENKELNDEFILSEMGRSTPTSKSREREISEMRAWAAQNCILASTPDVTRNVQKNEHNYIETD